MRIGRSSDVECVLQFQRLSAESVASTPLVYLPHVLNTGRQKMSLRIVIIEQTVIVGFAGNTG